MKWLHSVCWRRTKEQVEMWERTVSGVVVVGFSNPIKSIWWRERWLSPSNCEISLLVCSIRLNLLSILWRKRNQSNMSNEKSSQAHRTGWKWEAFHSFAFMWQNNKWLEGIRLENKQSIGICTTKTKSLESLDNQGTTILFLHANPISPRNG